MNTTAATRALGVVGWTGSRDFKSIHQPDVEMMVRYVAQFAEIVVGCQTGLDYFVRSAVEEKTLFEVQKGENGVREFQGAYGRAAYAKRSKAMIDYLGESRKHRGVNYRAVALMAWTHKPCPALVVPSDDFAGHGSGTWGTIAYAYQQGLPIFLYTPKHANIELPDWFYALDSGQTNTCLLRTPERSAEQFWSLGY